MRKKNQHLKNKYSFYKYYQASKKFDNLSFKSKYSFLAEFFNDLNKFNKLKTKRKNTKEKMNVHDTQLQNYIMIIYIYYIFIRSRKK